MTTYIKKVEEDEDESLKYFLYTCVLCGRACLCAATSKGQNWNYDFDSLV